MDDIAYVPVHKDLTQVKAKVFFSLTARQLICFGGGILVGLPLFFLINKAVPGSVATVIMICVMLPFFLFGLYEKNGQPLEKVLRYYILSRFLRPKKRSYKTENIYTALVRQEKLEKEVKKIVLEQKKRKETRTQGQADQD